MPINASQNMKSADIDDFLGNGWFMGLGPQRCLVAWGRPKKSNNAIPNKVQFFVPDYYLEDKKPWVVYEQAVVCETAELVKSLEKYASLPKLDLRFVDPDVEQFTETFKKIKSSINKKEINKAVPAVFSIAAGSMTKAMRAYFIRQTLMNANKQTAYGYLTPTEGVIGASPEILFTYDIRSYELVTMALAGTRNSKLEGEHSLSNDEKEMYEHGLVVSGLKKKLVNFGELQISPTYVWDLGTISHLRTDLLAELDKPLEPISLFAEACSLLHPTAALGVSPITSDWRYMKECDGQIKRARFGAPFGVVSPTGKSVALVAIRNLQWSEDGTISIGTGCGIVQDSNLQSEWQELTLKRDSIRKILGL